MAIVNIVNLDEFGTKDDRMSRIKKHGKTMKIWVLYVWM